MVHLPFVEAMARVFSNSNVVFLAALFGFLITPTCISAQDWPNHGGGLENTRYGSKEVKISPQTVKNLTLKWKFEAQKDITATPAIYNGVLYFPSWDGFVYAIKAKDGSLVWKQSIQKLVGPIPLGLVIPNVFATVARATPTIAPDLGLVIVGVYGPAMVVGLRMKDGSLVWKNRVDNHRASLITMSGTYYKGAFYVGVSSLEESNLPVQCCTFRGSFLKLNAKTGTTLWQTYMLPDNNGQTRGYAGAAIWGSSPSIDVSRNLVYMATGNLYSAPQSVLDCEEKESNQTVPTHPDQCVEPENHSESFLALDLDTGKIKWYHQLGGYDVWFLACSNFTLPTCPPQPNKDADFGEAPMLLSVQINGTKKDLVVATQKSGLVWALDRDNGNLVWTTEAGPGGLSGGGTWGSATDGSKVYTNIVNSEHKSFTLQPSNQTTNVGGWVAMDAQTGRPVWSTANPSGATCEGPVTVANGVVFAGSTRGDGPIYAMDAKTGEVLWSFETGATVIGGVSVSNGCIYFGHGYKEGLAFVKPTFTSGKTLFAFCVSSSSTGESTRISLWSPLLILIVMYFFKGF